jgi:predicted porin
VAIGVAPVAAMDLIKADSDNPFSLKLWVHASGVAAAVDQDDPFDELRDTGFVFNAEAEVRGAFTFNDGSQFGAFVEFELDNDDNEAVITDNGDDVIDKAFIYYKSVYGHLQFGAVDGAAEQMSISSPSVSRGPRINGGNIYFFQDPFNDQEYRPVALRTDLYASGDNIKIVYFTPRKWGLQAGVSYMSEFSHDLGEFFDGGETDFNQQSEMLEFGANWVWTIGKVDVAVGGTYLTASNEDPSFRFVIGEFDDDLEEWGLGANVGFGIDRFAIKLGGSYKESNASGGLIFGSSGTGFVNDLVDTTIWEIGGLVARGPWSVGVTYIDGDSQEENFLTLSGLSERNGQAWEVATGYKVGPGIKLNLGYQHFEYERVSGGFTSVFINGTTDELDALYLEAAVDL